MNDKVLYVIRGDDLAQLKRWVPAMAMSLARNGDTKTMVHARQLKKILSDIEWGYGPETPITLVECEDDDNDG